LAPPEGKLYAIFFHYPDEYGTNEAMSLFNQGQCDKAFITPCRGNLECLESIRKAKAKDMPDIANIPINTTDSFQGREGYVVILVFGVIESNKEVSVPPSPRKEIPLQLSLLSSKA